MPYFLLFCAFVLNSTANLLLKLGSQKGFDFADFSLGVLISHNWQFVVGCVLFVANVPFYFLSLKFLPLAVAYPVMVIMSFILVNILAYIFLKETINFSQYIGYGLLIIGLLMVTLNA